MNNLSNRYTIGFVLIIALVIIALVGVSFLLLKDNKSNNNSLLNSRPVGSVTYKASQTATTTNPIAYGTHHMLNSATSSMTT